LGALLAVVACGSGQSSSKVPTTARKFVFAPRVGLVFRHEMKNTDEFAIAGSSFRDSVERRILWEVKIETQGENYLYHRRLVELGLTINGAKILAGGEVEPRKAEIVQVMSHDGHALDITGTQELTDALVSLVAPANRARVEEMFSAANLRALLLARATDVFDEVVGKPAEVGVSWESKESFGVLTGKKVLVDSEVGCGGKHCLRLIRTFDVDQEKVGDEVRKRAAVFMTDLGGDPSALKLIDSNVKVEDTFLVEPETCHFHDSQLTQESRFVFEGPKHNRIEVALVSKQESHAEKPVPSN
jgi:hypothetical protein